VTSSSRELLWEIDFTSPAVTEIDSSIWDYQNGDGTNFGIPGWGNQEKQWYQPENASIDDSGLTFTATKVSEPTQDCYYGKAEWTSTRIASRGLRHLQYGLLEITMKVPTGKGSWPAFWMLGEDIDDNPWPHCGEIDVVETRGNAAYELIGTIHGPSYFADNGKGKSIFLDEMLGERFRTYAVDWHEDRIDWYLDGEKYHSVTAADVPAGEWVFNKPHYMLLNLAIGGGFAGEVDPELTEAKLEIQSIRHFAVDGSGQFF
jgi:beta-glucanase (GH16 family)